MKKKILLLGMCSILLVGCGKIPTLSNGDEAVVEFKGGDKISANELYNEIKDTYGLNTLMNMIDNYIYEKELKDKIDEANDYADAYLKQIRANYDNEEDYLNALSQSYGYQTEDAFKKVLYLSYLQNAGIEKYVTNNIKEEELKDYYDKEVYPSMTISHILIEPDVKEDATDEEKEKAEKKAQDKVKDLIKELQNESKENVATKFAELAKENSADAGSKDNGGSLGEINIGSLNSQYDELVKAASKLKDGEFSTEVITTELGYHVILKTKTGTKKSYEDSLESMKEAITEDKLSNNRSLIPDAIKYYHDKYELNIIDSNLDSAYGRYMNNLINAYKSTES